MKKGIEMRPRMRESTHDSYSSGSGPVPGLREHISLLQSGPRPSAGLQSDPRRASPSYQDLFKV
jgi:hypothetical protein